MILRPLIISLRIKHWVKNLFVFAALLFSLQLFNLQLAERTLWAFAVFCVTASSIYLINDLLDLKSDRQHPIKSLRPIASGSISPSAALLSAFFLLALGIGFAFRLDNAVGLVVLAYAVMNILYSRFLKHWVIVDVMVVALGFVFRALAGAEAINVEFSSWLLLSTFLLALFLAFGKRRHELTLLNNNATNHRPVLDQYSSYFLDQMIAVVTASTVVVYILYATSKEITERFHTAGLVYTVPFVLYGIFRYLYLIHKKESGGDPTKTLLTDRPLLIDIALWTAVVVAILYFNNSML